MSPLQDGHRFKNAGQLPIALEYYARALERNPRDAEAAQAFRIHFARYARYLKKKIARALQHEHPLFALKLATELIEYALWFEENPRLGRGGDLDLKALIKQKDQLIKRFTRSGFRDLQSRLSRGRALKSDLSFCQQLEVLKSHISSSKKGLSECDFLLRKFKWHAHFKLTTPPPFTHQRLYAELQAQLKEKRLEFLSLVDADSRRHNADLKLEIGQVYQETTPWFIAHQTSDHQWVNRGSSQDARWSLEPVHYDFYERRRTLYIPYRLQVVDLKTGRQVMMVEAQAQVSEVFKASEYQGALDLYDARVPERWGYPLQRRGRRLSTPFDLAVQSQSALVDEIVKRMTYVFN